MPEVQLKQGDGESLAHKLDPADGSASPPAARASGHKTPPLAVGLTALLLAGPVAAGAVAAGAVAAGAVAPHMHDSLPSLRAQFDNAFTPGAIHAPPGCCTVKLDP